MGNFIHVQSSALSLWECTVGIGLTFHFKPTLRAYEHCSVIVYNWSPLLQGSLSMKRKFRLPCELSHCIKWGFIWAQCLCLKITKYHKTHLQTKNLAFFKMKNDHFKARYWCGDWIIEVIENNHVYGADNNVFLYRAALLICAFTINSMSCKLGTGGFLRRSWTSEGHHILPWNIPASMDELWALEDNPNWKAEVLFSAWGQCAGSSRLWCPAGLLWALCFTHLFFFFPCSPVSPPPQVVLKMVAEIKKIPGISRVMYDLTSKPPGTTEWE